MSSEPVIALDGVWKRFNRDRRGGASLRGHLFGARRRRDAFWALRDVTFAVPAGATLGLIGGNGAGKSTLLRLVAGLSRPTSGTVLSAGETASILGLGTNFAHDLTGRENATTALVVNGFSRRAAEDRLEAVREFSELGAFFESPVRTYSAGMTLRLAFGVAAQLRARAFLIDEVLAVGDLRFQRKCLEHVEGLREDGATIVLASHDVDQVRELCDRVVWLHGGTVRLAGDPEEVVGAYEDAMRSDTFERTPEGDGDDDGLELRRNRFGSMEVLLGAVALNGGRDARVRPGESLRVRVRAAPAGPPRDVVVGISVRRAHDGLELLSVATDVGRLAGAREVGLTLERVDLVPGEYLVDVGTYAADWSLAYDYHWGAHTLVVEGTAPRSGVINPPVRWEVGGEEVP
jgi:homopolymeric O-antigen transport system ATP-binding protein